MKMKTDHLNVKTENLRKLIEFKEQAREIKELTGCKSSHAHEQLAREKGFKTYMGFIASLR